MCDLHLNRRKTLATFHSSSSILQASSFTALELFRLIDLWCSDMGKNFRHLEEAEIRHIIVTQVTCTCHQTVAIFSSLLSLFFIFTYFIFLYILANKEHSHLLNALHIHFYYDFHSIWWFYRTVSFGHNYWTEFLSKITELQLCSDFIYQQMHLNTAWKQQCCIHNPQKHILFTLIRTVTSKHPRCSSLLWYQINLHPCEFI
jgi:hypothetical protein